MARSSSPIPLGSVAAPIQIAAQLALQASGARPRPTGFVPSRPRIEALQPRITVTVGGVPAMQLKVGAAGVFQVIDGVGGTVRCWDESVGFVFAPGAPNAHGGTMSVFNNPQTFGVLARGVGDTNVEAWTPNQTMPLGDLMHLVVVAPDLWKPNWTVELKFEMWCVLFASHAFGPEVPGMEVRSRLIQFKGSVEPDASIPLDDFEFGILQNVLESKMVATYVDLAGKPTWTLTISCPASRDAADNSPVWYHKDSVKQLNASDGKRVETNDRPQNVVPWQTKDNKGTLVSTGGVDKYCTWLAARQKSSGTFVFFRWAAWSVNWGCAFDFKAQRGKLTAGKTNIDDQGEGQGLNTPITAGKRAIEQTTMAWTGPAGGY
jgi:hypothetical protein